MSSQLLNKQKFQQTNDGTSTTFAEDDHVLNAVNTPHKSYSPFSPNTLIRRFPIGNHATRFMLVTSIVATISIIFLATGYTFAGIFIMILAFCSVLSMIVVRTNCVGHCKEFVAVVTFRMMSTTTNNFAVLSASPIHETDGPSNTNEIQGIVRFYVLNDNKFS